MWQTHKTSIIVFVAIVAMLAAFWHMPTFAFVFFLSVLLTMLLLDPVDKLSNKIPRGIAALLTLVAFLLVALGLITVVSSSFIPTLHQFSEELPALALNLQQLDGLSELTIFKSGVDEIWSELTAFSTQVIRSSLVIVFSLFNKLIDFVIIIFLTFYFLLDGVKIKSFVATLFPREDQRRISNLLDKILGSLRAYIRSQIIICFIMGVIVYCYFSLMGLPYASVFGVLSAISEFIPVLGPTVASGFGILMTAMKATDLTIPTAFFYLFMTQINHNLIYPAIVGKSLHLHPVAIILAIILGGELLGAAGMFLAVPFMVVLKHVVEDINAHSHII